MALRSHNISYSTADQADVLAFPGSNGNLTADQQRCLCNMRKAARARQDDLDHQGVGWGLPIPEALDHLLAGHTSSAAECAGNAYYCALQIIIDRNASDPYTLGAYSKPSTFFRLVDEEMRRLGVPDDLLPHGYLYGGLPWLPPYTTLVGRVPDHRPPAAGQDQARRRRLPRRSRPHGPGLPPRRPGSHREARLRARGMAVGDEERRLVHAGHPLLQPHLSNSPGSGWWRSGCAGPGHRRDGESRGQLRVPTATAHHLRRSSRRVRPQPPQPEKRRSPMRKPAAGAGTVAEQQSRTPSAAAGKQKRTPPWTAGPA